MLFSTFLHDLTSVITLENCQSNAPNFSLTQFSLHKLSTTLLIFLNRNKQGQATFLADIGAAINWQVSTVVQLAFFLPSEGSVKQWFLLMEQICRQSLCTTRNSFRGLFRLYKL